MRSPLLLGVAASVLLAAAPALAGGFYLQEQSVKGLGRAYSGEASDTGAESLWWNPAAIAQVDGVEIVNGAHAILTSVKSTDDGSTISRPGQAPAGVGGDPRISNPVLFGVVPNGDVAWRINDHLSVGLAISSPFNFITKNPDSSWARYEGEKSLLFNLDIQPTIAVHVNRFIDLGAGFDAQYTAATLSNALPNLSPLLPDGQQVLTGDGWDYGFIVGAQLHPTDRLTFGLSYRSGIKHDLDGTIQVSALQGTGADIAINSKASASFRTPWIATIGGRWRATDRLAVSAQVQHFGWSDFDTINVGYGTVSTVVPQSYRDTTSVGVGADFDVTRRWTVRAGVQYDPTPTPDVGRSVRVPDSDRFLFTAGTTVRPSAHLALDLSAGYIDFEGAHVNSRADAFAGTLAYTPVNMQGDVSGEGVVLSAGARLSF